MDLDFHEPLTAEEIVHVKQITNTGELYYDYDPLIEQARNHAFYVCRKYNDEMIKDNFEEQPCILAKLFGSLGKNAKIAPGFITEFGFNLHIGDNFKAGHNLKMIDCNMITIGDDVMIGEECGIYTSNHAFDAQKRADHWCSEQPIMIGNNVVIENNVTILPGVKIGDNVLIKTGSVVTKNIDGSQVVVGIPCRPVQ